MFYVKTIQRFLLLLVLGFTLSACDIDDDLHPSSNDLSSQGIAADFTVKDIYNNDFVLYDHLTIGANTSPADAVVLYFTMYCPICTADTAHIQNTVIPQFSSRGTVTYVLVDYLSGSITTAYDYALANGVSNPAYFTVLADIDNLLENQFTGTMGITVVIASDGTVLMHEEYNSNNLIDTLNQYLP